MTGRARARVGRLTLRSAALTTPSPPGGVVARGHTASAIGVAVDVGALTMREREVIDHLAAGWSNAAIAARLGCTCRTVESHVDHIFDKLGVPRDPAINRRVFAARCYLSQVPPGVRASTDVARLTPT